jgi:hypothetical protein
MARTPLPPPAPEKIPGRINRVLYVVGVLIAHARHVVATVATRVTVPEFAVAAAVFGTYDVTTIRFRIQRGIRRALALQQYLLERAARGRNLNFAWRSHLALLPHHRPPPRPAPKKRATPRAPRRRDPSLLDDSDPGAFYLPTPAELAAEVRRRPVGLTITSICLDLGLVPGLCEGEFWNHIYDVFRAYGGNINSFYRVRARREVTFQRERDRMPDTWHINWRDFSPDTVRRALGCRIGEPPPAIVPS